MVPMDKPRPALDMLSRFLHGRAFSDVKQKALGVGSCNSPDFDCSEAVDCATLPSAAAPAAETAVVNPNADPTVVVAAGGGVVSLKTTPPTISGTPSVGRDFAVVSFSHEGVGDAPSLAGKGGGGGEGSVEVTFEVRSSPDGLVGTGASTPVAVAGLTPGRTYTFSVTAVYARKGVDVAVGEGDGGGGARSMPSVGSAAVTPGCGSITEGGGGVSGEPGTGDSGPLLVLAACSGHGVCREGGEGGGGECVCEHGFGGEACGILIGETGGGGGGGPGEVGAAAAARSGDIKLLREEDVSTLKASSDKVGQVIVFLPLFGPHRIQIQRQIPTLKAVICCGLRDLTAYLLSVLPPHALL